MLLEEDRADRISADLTTGVDSRVADGTHQRSLSADLGSGGSHGDRRGPAAC
jgi:hypothetical protein